MHKIATLTVPAILVLFFAETLLFADWVPDDAFICFRYAHNFAEGLGLVFNAGDRVEGISNPLWTVLLGLLTKTGLSTVKTAVVLSFLCALVSIWLVWRLFGTVLEAGDHGGTRVPETGDGDAAREQRKLIGLKTALTVALAASLPTIFFATSGLETHAELAFLLLGITLHLNARSRGEPWIYAASQSAFLAVALLRPEGIMYLLIGAAFVMFGRPGRTRAGGAVWIGMAAPVVIYAIVLAVKASYYDTILPNTYLAKPGAGINYLKPLSRGTFYLIRFFLVSGLVTILPFSAIAFADKRRRYACTFLATVAAAQLVFILLVGGDVLRFDRFTLPFTPPLLALALVGFIRTDSLVCVKSRRFSLAAAVFCVTVLIGLNAGRAYVTLKKHCYHDWMHAQVHRSIGAYLASELPPGSGVVVNEVGAIAYTSGLAVYDMIGLTDATVGRAIYESYMRFGVSGSTWSVPRIADYLMSRKPECVVIPAYGEIDPGLHEPPAKLMHPIWEGLFRHEDLARFYRCAFGLQIHSRKYLYFYFRDDIRVDGTSLRNALPVGRCISIKDYTTEPATHGD